MPTLSPDLISGDDKAKDIDDKVMDVVNALWWVIQNNTLSAPSGAAVTIEDALTEFISGAFSAVKVAGEDTTNGIRIRDLNNGGTPGEYRIAVKADFSAHGGAATPAVVIQKRYDTGDFSNLTGSCTWTDVFAITEDTIWHTDSDISDLASTIATMQSAIATNASNIAAIPGGGSVQTTVVEEIPYGGVDVGYDGNGTYQVRVGVAAPSVVAGPLNDGDSLQWTSSGITWASPTLPAFYYGKAVAPGNLDLTLDFSAQAQKPSGGSDWEFASGELDVPYSGYYQISVSGYVALNGSGRPTIVLTAGGVDHETVAVTADISGFYWAPFTLSIIKYLDSDTGKISVTVEEPPDGTASAAGAVMVHLSVALIG
jgi:hypothetical protein